MLFLKLDKFFLDFVVFIDDGVDKEITDKCIPVHVSTLLHLTKN